MVRAIMIIEMAGRPATHLTKSLEEHVGVLRDVKDAEVHEIKVSEPRAIARENEGQKSDDKEGGEALDGHDSGEPEMFTAFAECDIEMPSFARLSETMFDFMPSSIEVIEPSSVDLSMSEATDLLNNISGRMHRYDEIAKVAGEKLRQMNAQMQAMHAALIKRDKVIAELKNVCNNAISKKTDKALPSSKKKK